MVPESYSAMTDYHKIGASIASLITEKQRHYGDAFGKSGEVMRILYPNGIPPEKLDDALAVTRVLDKLFRIATSRDALAESPWVDIAGYALLAVGRTEPLAETHPEGRSLLRIDCPDCMALLAIVMDENGNVLTVQHVEHRS